MEYGTTSPELIYTIILNMDTLSKGKDVNPTNA